MEAEAPVRVVVKELAGDMRTAVSDAVPLTVHVEDPDDEGEGVPVSGAKVKPRVYTGRAMAPVVMLGGVKLAQGVDCTCVVRDAAGKVVTSGKVKVAGRYEVTITGLGDYAGTTTATFTVRKADVRDVSVSKIPERAFTGRAIKPAPKVTFNGKKLTKGVDYTVAYKHNKARGTAIVKIKGKGNFTGEKNAAFRIV